MERKVEDAAIVELSDVELTEVSGNTQVESTPRASKSERYSPEARHKKNPKPGARPNQSSSSSSRKPSDKRVPTESKVDSKLDASPQDSNAESIAGSEVELKVDSKIDADAREKSDTNNKKQVVHPSQKMISIKLSDSLHKKIKVQASEEGVSFEELVVEYLAESATLRAWEIIERKAQMRQPSSGQMQGQNRQPFSRRKGGGGGNGGNNRGMSQGRYQNIMEDKASFLEYVRTQEKNRR